MHERAENVRLEREGDQVMLVGPEKDSRQAVKLAWTRPISAKGMEVSFLNKEKKEVLMLSSLERLDAESRRIAEDELAKRYLMPRITRILRASAAFGVRYWHVETDLGERRFALKNASKNAVWLSEDHLVLRDTLGCLYEVRPYGALDARSRLELEKVI